MTEKEQIKEGKCVSPLTTEKCPHCVDTCEASKNKPDNRISTGVTKCIEVIEGKLLELKKSSKRPFVDPEHILLELKAIFSSKLIPQEKRDLDQFTRKVLSSTGMKESSSEWMADEVNWNHFKQT